MKHLQGWSNDPREVERIWGSMPTPFFQSPAPENRDQHNHLIFRDMTGGWHDEGPQMIGDCVSWGNSRLVDYTSVLEAYLDLEGKIDAPDYLYEQCATEVLYALSRVEVGQGRLRGSDGSVGAWAAKALTDFGWISRPELDRLGVGGKYSGARAKQWGDSGLPNSLEPAAIQHTLADMTPVRNFNDLAFHTQNYRVVAICSNVGFENAGNGSQVRRDAQGFATPRGTWGHCMTVVSSRMGNRPGGLLTNQWPTGSVVGPMGDVEIPPCSWWVDAHVLDSMLAQNDSFTGTKVKGYPARKLTWRF